MKTINNIINNLLHNIIMIDYSKSNDISFTINPETGLWVISIVMDGYLDIDQNLTGSIYEIVIPEKKFIVRGTVFQVRRGEERFEMFLNVNQDKIVPLLNERVFDKDQLYSGAIVRRNFLTDKKDLVKNVVIVILVLIVIVGSAILAYQHWKNNR